MAMKKIDLSVKIASVTLKNPIVTLSGTCGFGQEYAEYFAPSSIGAVAVKGLTLLPRDGNGLPRIAETPSGMLNCIGLQNPGVEKYIEVELPRLKAQGATVIANISGANIDEYCEMAKILSETDTDLIEMNISCPNVKAGGVAFGTDERVVYEITSRVKAASKKPLIVKLSPNVTDITKMAKAAESGGADALSLINTLLGMKIDTKAKKPLLSNTFGGLSGPAVFPVALRMVWQVRRVTNLPIIGMGGICDFDSALQMLMAGADALGLGTVLFNDPYAPVTILEQLKKYMEENSIEKLSDIRI